MSRETKEMDKNLPLPPDKMPKCWNEDERMNALFSPFRSKLANPLDWSSKYKFWQSLIHEWLNYRMQCSFSIVDLHVAFRRKGCTPVCLVTVVEELLRNNEIISETDFLKEPCESWTAWSIDIFVKRPLVWSFSKVKSYVMSNEINKETVYIHQQVLKNLGETVLSVLENKKENVLVSFSEIVKDCKSEINENISDNTVMLVLIWLRREKRVSFTNNTDNHELLIKIAVHSSDNVTEVEQGLYKLLQQENELLKEIVQLEEAKLNVINEAKSYLARGLRQVAKTRLRKKLELENTIQKRAQTLENIRTLISTIEETHTNTAVLSAYKTGSDVLKKLNESGLSENNARDIMDDLAEALEEQNEVQSILSDTFKDNESNADLEQELEELMKLEEPILPSVPNSPLKTSVDELEDSFKKLHFENPTIFKKSSSESRSQSIKQKQVSANLEYA
ncbi:charged multivesicular body protein 7 [Halictus rubicundus]|uniref:charged multivesicular body protein 7 n=1 Tax=Halictus rubicundus TaxID=77578 RepID=UPI004034FCD4